MIANVRIRKYKTEWLAWWQYGNVIPLLADTPDKEPAFNQIDSNATYQQPYIFHGPATVDFNAWMKQLLHHVKDQGEKREKEKRQDHGGTLYVVKPVDIAVERIVCQVNQNTSKKWSGAGDELGAWIAFEVVYNFIADKFIIVETKEGLPREMQEA